jgi:hypothetical protein
MTTPKKPGNSAPLRHYKIYTLLLFSDIVGFDHHSKNYLVDLPDAARALSIKTSQLRETLQYMQIYGLIKDLKDYGSRRAKFQLVIPDLAAKFGAHYDQ